MSKTAETSKASLATSEVRECCRGKVNNRNQTVGAPVSSENRPPAWRRILPHALTVAASILLLVSLKLPLWRMHLEAPQYRDQEALNIAVHPDRLNGDLRELTTLDQYIGVHVPKTLPQFKWLPGLLISGAAFGLLTVVLPRAWRKHGLVFVACALTSGLAWAAFQATTQIRDIGHKRDQKTVLAGIKDFTPPFLGTSKIAQFTVSSWFGVGAWLIGGALALQLGAAWSTRPAKLRRECAPASRLDEDESLVAAASH